MRKIICFFFCSALCCAADWSTLYDSSQLEAQRARLQIAIDFLIQKEIRPFLPPLQATAFGLQQVDLPLNGRSSNPLEFYAENNHIVLPVRTLLFVEDLSRVYGWMWSNRYSTRTVDEYLSMLRYRAPSDFADNKYPSPLSALHVPETALSDPRVVETSVRLRRTAYAFLLLHQFAHLRLHHEGHPFTESQEEDADRFALNIMKENSVTPTGIYLLMNSSVLFETGEGIGIHPVTAHRLLALAHSLEAHFIEITRGRPDKAAAMDGIHNISYLLVEGSEWLASPGLNEDLRQLALKTSPDTLQPRPLPKTTK